jgi:outer membrane protein TolC
MINDTSVPDWTHPQLPAQRAVAHHRSALVAEERGEEMTWRWPVLLMATATISRNASAQGAPPSPNRPWHFSAESEIREQARALRVSRLAIEATKVYSLADLVDFAERNNPETRVAWEDSKARGAALHIAQSELYPALVGLALSQYTRQDVLFNTTFFRQTVAAFGPGLQLNYTLFDFGARAGRIEAARAELSAANFGFNDTHRRIIFQVADTYYRLLNAVGQVDAAQASLLNAKTVQEAAEQRLKHGLATLPDALEATSATAQAEYDLQSARGAEEIAHGDLATTLGISPTVSIRVQRLDELPPPVIQDKSIEQLLDRALEQRPDLLQQVAGVQAAEARVREARAAYYPSVKLEARAGGSGTFFYGWQPPLSAVQTTDLTASATLRLDWTLFDGGARKNTLLRAEALQNVAAAQAEVVLDQIAGEVWRSHSNVKTALRQRQAATALLQAASKSYAAAVEAYGYGVRSLLDVTAAQRALAQARSADVAARTQVLDRLAELAFRTGDLMRISGAKDPR